MTETAQVAIVREICRVCGSPLRSVLNLGNFALSDFVQEHVEDVLVPLELVACENFSCQLVQLKHTVDRDKLYRHFWYLSGINPSMVASLRNVVESVEARVELKPGDTVIDIGTNDGTLLTLYSAKTQINKIGFDPAENLAAQARLACDLYVNDFFETSAVLLPRAKVITSIAMFYDLDDPRQFLERIRDVLDQDGVWVMQMTDLVRMLKANAFDNICHEHLCYYSLYVFKNLVEQYGLEVFDVEFNDVNGGSLRAYVGFQGVRDVQKSVKSALLDETVYLEHGGLERFRTNVEFVKDRVSQFIRTEKLNGKRFHVLGASTKGNTLLQYFGLTNNEIDFAAEVNESKFGLRTAGSGITIVSQEESISKKPDYYLVLPWHFIDFFRHKFADYMVSGGVLLTPLPVPQVHRFHATHL